MRKVLITFCLLAVIAAGGYAWHARTHGPFTRSARPANDSYPCPGERQTVDVTDSQINGLAKGARVDALMGWYGCNAPKRGDLVVYRYSTERPPVIRRLVGVPGDEFQLVRDSKQPRWHLKINGELIGSKGQPYFFGTSAPPLLSLYEKSHAGRLADGNVIILSDVAPGGLDSGSFGVGSTQDLLGKVVFPRERR